MKRCNGNPEADRRHIALVQDKELMHAIGTHADPEWWSKGDGSKPYNNTAYLKRWGTYLRREARRRGLL